jgi:hypothetical protein
LQNCPGENRRGEERRGEKRSFFFFQNCEVGGLAIIQKRTLAKFGSERLVREESRKV